jgi:hypothetical protein
MTPIRDREIARLHARALVAIARIDDEIEADEGERLSERIAARCDFELRLEDLLLEPPLSPEQFAALVKAQDGPFRSASITVREVGAALVEDGIAIMMAKGHATETEAARLWRYAEALGLSREEFQRLTASVAPWLSSTDIP